MSDLAGKGCEILVPFNERKPLKEIERSITTKYRGKIWAKFIKAIEEYKLLEEGDKVAVAISGGKDSMLMAKLFQQLKKHSKFDFDVEYIVMDPGYHPQIKDLLIDNCKYLDIPIQIFESGIFDIADKMAKDYPCFLCAKMRRGALYGMAQKLGCNKLALGHHYNDVIETTLLNVLYSGNFRTMLPKLKSQNYEGIELIRPLYFIEERHIQGFTQNAGIWPLNCACMVAAKKIAGKRYEIKEMIEKLRETNPDIEKSIFKSAENVYMDSILGWRKGENKYSFLGDASEENE